MKVTWPRQAIPQLQFPSICAVTGEPAERPVLMVFRKGWASYIPGIARIIVNATNRPVPVAIPLSAAVTRKLRTWRLATLGVVLVGLLIVVLGIAVDADGIGGGLSALALVLILVGIVVTNLMADVVGTDVDGDWISMSKAHPRFVEAFVAANPPGMITAEGRPAPQGYGQPAYPQPFPSPQNAPQPAYPQPQGYPQPAPQAYPQQAPQQAYPQQAYAPQEAFPQQAYPQQAPQQQTYPAGGWGQPTEHRSTR